MSPQNDVSKTSDNAIFIIMFMFTLAVEIDFHERMLMKALL